MKRVFLSCLVLSLLCLICPANGEQAAEYDGYLFRLAPGYPRLFGLSEGIEPVAEEAGVYRAGSLEDIARFAPAEALAYVEPDHLVTLFDSPNDPLYTQQWSLRAMGAEAAWAAGLDGSGVRIGIVDSGLDTGHEDLAGARIIPGSSYALGSGNTNDEYGHGTFVAGVIAAVPGNGTGLAGLAPGAEIVPLKCFRGKTTQVSYIVKAIYGGVDDYDCDILNLSFGLATDNQSLREAVEYAEQQGLIVVAAVGNDGESKLYYPAAYPSVIGVGSLGEDMTVAKNSQRNSSVYVTAPGYQVLGLDLSREEPYKPGNGTSYATPHIAAALAILKQAQPELNGAAARQLLAAHAQDLGDPGYDTSYGYGFISLSALLQRIQPFVRYDHGVLYLHEPCRPEALRFWLAEYRQDGRLLCLTLLPAVQTEEGRSVHTQVRLDPRTAKVKMLYLSEEGFLPAAEAKTWTPQGWLGLT